MSTINKIPTNLFEDLYLAIPNSLNPSEMINALAADEKARLFQDGIKGTKLRNRIDEFKEQLFHINPVCLAELIYETCITNDTFDVNNNRIWVDRTGSFSVNPNEIHKHFFCSAIHSLNAKILGFDESRLDKEDIQRQIDKICQDGKGMVTLGNNQATIAFSAERQAAKVTAITACVSPGDAKRIDIAFNRFLEKCFIPGLSLVPNETLMRV